MASEQSQCFKAFVDWTKQHHANWNLKPVMKNGKFSHFFDADTDTAWMGFQAAWNTRPAPAATDTGLVTVGGEYLDGHTWKPMPAGVTDFALRGFKTRALCDRSQAEELLAAEIELKLHWKDEAERFRIEFEKAAYDGLLTKARAEKAEADNAAKDAAIKRWRSEWERAQSQNVELAEQLAKAEAKLAAERAEKEELRRAIMGKEPALDLQHGNFLEMAATLHRACDGARERSEALEAKLAAAEKALEAARPYVEDYDTRRHNTGVDETLTQIDAVLGGKPS